MASLLAGQQVLRRLIDFLVRSIGDTPLMFEDDETIVRRGKRGLRTVQFHDLNVREEYGHLNLEVSLDQ